MGPLIAHRLFLTINKKLVLEQSVSTGVALWRYAVSSEKVQSSYLT